MATAIISNRPSTPFNWADDDEDDFDFETWKATADTSTPTVDDLGPLQLPPAEDESDVIFTTISKVNEPAPWATTDQQSPSMTESLKPSEDLRAESVDWQVHQAQIWLVTRALEEESDAPAYREISFYEDLSPSPQKRVSYTHNWNRMKADSGQDCRRTVLFRFSPLSEVSFADEEDVQVELDGQVQQDIAAYEQFSEIAVEDVPNLCEADGEESDLDDASSIESGEEVDDEVKDIPQAAQDAHKIEVAPDAHATHITSITNDAEFDFVDVFEDKSDTDFRDEGYHSESPPISPTFAGGNDEDDLSLSVTTLGIRPTNSFALCRRKNRRDSLEALGDLRKNVGDEDTIEDATHDEKPLDLETCEDTEINIVNDEPLEATDLIPTATSAPTSTAHTPFTVSETPSPDLKHITPGPSIGDYLAATVSTGWFFLSSVPWTKVGVVAAGAVAAGVLHMARRR